MFHIFHVHILHFAFFALCIFHILYFALCSGRVYGGRLAGRPVGEGSDYDRVTLGVTIELATTQLHTTKRKIGCKNSIEFSKNKTKEPCRKYIGGENHYWRQRCS